MSSYERLFAYVCIYAKMCVLLLWRRPYKLTLLASGGCNLRCQVCSIWRHANTTLTLAEVKQMWAAFPVKPCWINVSGGEPTLNSELESILGFFVQLRRSVLITLTSNGYADCSRLVERVLERNYRSILYVSVSVDGDEPEHNLARGRPESYARVWQTHQNLHALATRFAALKVGISTTISRVNYRRILPFIERAIAQGAALSINLSQTSPYYRSSSGDAFQHLPRVELVNLLRAIQRALPKFGLDAFIKLIFLASAIRHLEGRHVPLPCASHVNNVLVTSELDLVNCTLLFRPWIPRGASREAKLDGLLEAIRSPSARVNALRREVRASGCEQHCHTPCESYVHIISALLRPWLAVGLVWAYLCVCLQSLFASRRERELALGRCASANPLLVMDHPARES